MQKKISIILLAGLLFLTGCSSQPDRYTIPAPIQPVITGSITGAGDKTSEKAPEQVQPAEGSKAPAEVQIEPQEPSESQKEVSNGKLCVEFIDVGQGDSILIITPAGKSILIDAGDIGKESIIISRLKANNVKQLDVVIATHPHADHIGSMASIISSYPVKAIYMPDIIHTTKTFENLLNTIQSKGLKVNIAKAGVEIPLDNALGITFMSPVNAGSDLNNASAVLKITHNKKSFLFMGDLEKSAEGNLSGSLDVDVLKVGHHGSDTSSGTSFLKKVTPVISVISVGQGNKYGHPANTTMQNIKSSGSEVYRTDISGTIRVESDGTEVKVVNAKPYKVEAVIPTPVVEAPVKEPEPPTQNPQEVAIFRTKTGSKYHLDGCSALKSKIALTLKEAKSLGLEPCKICNPPN